MCSIRCRKQKEIHICFDNLQKGFGKRNGVCENLRKTEREEDNIKIDQALYKNNVNKVRTYSLENLHQK